MKKVILIITLQLFVDVCFSQNQNRISKLDKLNPNVEKLMTENNLKGLSVAVFEDYKIIWTKQWGIKANDSKDRIDKNTAFSTASISKPITALLCVILEEKGLINLDDPISKYIKRWNLPESEFTKGVEVTWKHLLSHTAGTSQSGFEDYYTGDSIPNIVESLQGKLLPREKKPIEFLFKPGTDYSYSGGGYVIIQLALEDHLGKPLSEIIREHLLEPLNLKNSSMIQPNENNFLNNIAKVHNHSGAIIKTGIPITPQVAPSGLWSTPTDLAIIAIEIQKALTEKGNTIISTSVAKKVTEIATMSGPRGWSMGWQRSIGWGNQEWFSHDGSNTGVGGELLATMENGNGIAILANGDKPNRFPLMSYVKNEVINSLNWNIPFNKKKVKEIPLNLAKAISGYYTEILYGYNRSGNVKIVADNKQMYLISPVFKQEIGVEKCRMYYLGENTFKVNNYPNLIQFNINKNGVLEGITIFKDKADENKLKIPLTKIRTPETELTEIFSENKFEEAVAKFNELKLKYPSVNFENALNTLGYSFFNAKKNKLSIQIFSLNCKEYPMSWNTYDSLGEIYEATGNFKLAKENYQKSLELNPSNKSAVEMLKRIENK